MIPKLKAVTTVTASLAAASRTSTTNGTGVDLKGATDVLAILNCAAASAGTNPTWDVTIEDSADNSSFAAVSGLAFTQVTNAASTQTMQIDPRAVRRYVRAVGTIGGTSSPAFTSACLIQVANREV